jgi:hypothetical protein
MIGLLTSLIVFLSFACNSDNSPSHQSTQAVKKDKSELNDDPFDLKFQIEKMENDLYSLAVTIDLFDGSFIVSPHSQDSVYGHFDIIFKDFGNIVADKTLSEIPASYPEIDPILNTLVRFVRGKTTYKQNIHILTKGDFDASGMIWFVLEPSCVPYDVEFRISSRSGKMTITKTKTAVSAGYKG